MKPVSFGAMYNRLKTGPPVTVRLEHRAKPFKFGVNNYGEIPGFINEADGDPWDIIVPGYPELPTDMPFKSKKFLGIFMLPDGNHKLIMDIHTNQKMDKELSSRELDRYQTRYNAFTGLGGYTVFF